MDCNSETALYKVVAGQHRKWKVLKVYVRDFGCCFLSNLFCLFVYCHLQNVAFVLSFEDGYMDAL